MGDRNRLYVVIDGLVAAHGKSRGTLHFRVAEIGVGNGFGECGQGGPQIFEQDHPGGRRLLPGRASQSNSTSALSSLAAAASICLCFKTGQPVPDGMLESPRSAGPDP
jgi:hypothetical protein